MSYLRSLVKGNLWTSWESLGDISERRLALTLMNDQRLRIRSELTELTKPYLYYRDDNPHQSAVKSGFTLNKRTLINSLHWCASLLLCCCYWDKQKRIDDLSERIETDFRSVIETREEENPCVYVFRRLAYYRSYVLLLRTQSRLEGSLVRLDTVRRAIEFDGYVFGKTDKRLDLEDVTFSTVSTWLVLKAFYLLYFPLHIFKYAAILVFAVLL